MDAHSALRPNISRSLPPQRVRLTRLNIYSGLFVEFARCRILVDPSKIPPDVAPWLTPDVILVSHESMDHFDPAVVLRLLENPGARMIGSWGVMIALAESLPATDPRWDRIYVGMPGALFTFGDLQVCVEAAQHCEYAVPLFFDIRDVHSGFRILDLIDTDITPRLREGPFTGPDILVVPTGIALGAHPAKAWEMVGLLKPARVFASHFTHERNEFLARAPGEYAGDRVVACSWHESVTFAGPPAFGFQPTPSVAWAGQYVPPLPADWMIHRPSVSAVLGELAAATDPEHVSAACYFAAATAVRGEGANAIRRGVLAAREKAVTSAAPVTAAYLLALGTALGAAEEAVPSDLAGLAERLDADQPYLGYWILECCGRAGMNPALQETTIDVLERTAATPSLWGQVGIRRKLMWEVDRLVTQGVRWPGLLSILVRGTEDHNPDVRLLSFKLLPLIRPNNADGAPLLRRGLEDPHEDVIEWAVRAHIDLFETIDDVQRAHVRDALPRLLTHGTYQVRDRASVLAELLAAG